MTAHCLNQDYDVKCTSGITRKQSELERAFDLIAPKQNWKMPIDMTLDYVMIPVDFALLTDACIHFTGSVPTFTYLKHPELRITAAGYYATIGA